MTCIAGIVDNGKIWMGGDSMSASYSFHAEISLCPKVFKLNNFLIGYTSSWRMGQLLAHKLALPQIKNKELMSYMINDFVGAVFKAFEKGKWLQKKDDRVDGGTFLVGVKGRLFRIQDDFAVLECATGFDAVGCGQDSARGSLYSTQNFKLSPKDRINLALEASEYCSAGVRKPFHILYI